MTKTRLILALGLMMLLPACKETPQQRATRLVSQMNLEQKAALMEHESKAIPELGIPAYNWWNEALHGVARNGKATVFPQPIGMAASFDEPLLYQVFTTVSDEGRVKNRQALRENGEAGWYQGVTFWTPNINIFRDPRWGRGMETYGEDPYLTGQLGMAVVRGLQGPADAKVLKAHACAKHFAVHSGPEWNRHTYNAQVSERDLRETYLPAFKDLVTKAGVQEVMIAYNRFRDVPCGANDYLINTILRGEWGYQGIVVSDCWAIRDFYAPGAHGYSEDAAHATALALQTGTDINCGSTAEEKAEMKKYSRLADAFTPICKGMNSEYANQNAYDAIGVHGGSGFIMEYKAQRLFRDARIFSIYEGTTQLQVVAAIRYITNGTYLSIMKDMLEAPVSEAMQPLKERVAALVDTYEKTVEAQKADKEEEKLDFVARRLYDMTGVILMSLLIIADASKAPELFEKSANVYVRLAEAEVARNVAYVATVTPDSLDSYRQA